jgi:hypothetical protein
MPRQLAASGRASAASILPRYNSASETGIDSSGSRLLRSFSPTNVSSAMMSEKEMGKKPTIISKKGLSRSAMMAFWPPYCRAKLRTVVAVKSIKKGKIIVRMRMGMVTRQSRRLSRSSRRVMMSAVLKLLCWSRFWTMATAIPPPGVLAARDAYNSFTMRR